MICLCIVGGLQRVQRGNGAARDGVRPGFPEEPAAVPHLPRLLHRALHPELLPHLLRPLSQGQGAGPASDMPLLQVGVSLIM